MKEHALSMTQLYPNPLKSHLLNYILTRGFSKDASQTKPSEPPESLLHLSLAALRSTQPKHLPSAPVILSMLPCICF